MVPVSHVAYLPHELAARPQRRDQDEPCLPRAGPGLAAAGHVCPALSAQTVGHLVAPHTPPQACRAQVHVHKWSAIMQQP